MLFICVQIVACSKETNPKKAFDNGDYTTSFKIWETYAKQGDDEAQNYLFHLQDFHNVNYLMSVDNL